MLWRIFRREITRSTNLDAQSGAPGDVFTAEFQTAGRGRLNHEWQSGKGVNLMFSAVLSVDGMEMAEAATLPLVAGLACLKALVPFVPGHRVSLKWPNDVLCDDRKLAGILCERNGDKVIVGVGINVNETSFPPEIADRATSLKSVAERQFDREQVLAAVLDSLSAWYRRWRQAGFAAVHEEFAAIDHLLGRNIAVLQTPSDSSPVTGLCHGIQADGTLLVGETPVFAGEAHVTEHCLSPR